MKGCNLKFALFILSVALASCATKKIIYQDDHGANVLIVKLLRESDAVRKEQRIKSRFIGDLGGYPPFVFPFKSYLSEKQCVLTKNEKNSDIQTLFCFKEKYSSEFIMWDNFTRLKVELYDRKYSQKISDSLYFYKFTPLSHMSGIWRPMHCVYSKKNQIVELGMTINSPDKVSVYKKGNIVFKSIDF
ncbi:hypothetical protein [Hymenobacter actinosclerus]|uniref:Lipoprotein n=1 Tax=Hymenobacter actinosclerus TaxID=82805 RepID=A0A1I0HJI9_9BACT|nr:hypothetical protein [Hymenobacter actinosclerus]SET83861.1 hypothetical protein SAMN04487998_2956 [Hymenobacter actinosclerus]